VLLGVTRSGGESANAATVLDQRATHNAGRRMAPLFDRGAAALAAQPMISDFELAPTPAPLSAAVPAPLRPLMIPAALPVATPPGAEPTSVIPLPAARSTAPRSTTSHPSHPPPARKPPSTPHRKSKVDPDGTLDPYR